MSFAIETELCSRQHMLGAGESPALSAESSINTGFSESLAKVTTVFISLIYFNCFCDPFLFHSCVNLVNKIRYLTRTDESINKIC